MPGLKRTVYEFCQKCGEQDARLREDGWLVWGVHNCPHVPTGPHEPLRLVRPDSVNFVRKVPNA